MGRWQAKTAPAILATSRLPQQVLNAQKAAHFEATAADLEREKQLQGSIQQTYTALEAVKEQRDAMVQVLQAAAGTEQPAQGQQQQSTGSDKQLSNAILADELWALPFRERADRCCSLFFQAGPAPKAIADTGGEDGGSPDGLVVDTDYKALAGLTAAQLPDLLEAVLLITPETLLKEWADLGQLAAEVVQLYDDGELTEEGVMQRMCNPIMYYETLGNILTSHKPEVLQSLWDFSRLPGETEEQERRRWREVAIGMQMSAEEVQCLVPLFQTYCERMQQLSADTAASLETLQEVQQHLTDKMLESTLSTAAKQYLRVFDAAGQLHRQSHAALFVTMDFFNSAGAKVSLLPQLRMAALCRPLHPDIVSIVREGLDHVGLLSPTLREAAVGAKRLP